jgi:glycosyltransferase involved in cell wall biosynthesis
MKILSIGLDKEIFVKNSVSQKRQIEYGALFDETHIVIFNKRDTNNANNIRMIRMANNGKRDANDTNDIRIIRMANNVFLYSTNSKNKLSYLFDGYKIAKSIIKENKISVITTQDPFETGLLGWLLKKKFKIPLLIQVHTELPFRYFAFESFLNFFRWFLALFLIRKADRLRVVSLKIKDYIVKKFPYLSEKIDVLPILVDVEKLTQKGEFDIKQKYPGFSYYFLTLSRLVKFKNIPLQLKALSKLKQKYYKFLLIIVGDGPERKRLEKLVIKLNLKENVVFEGWQKNIGSYLKSSDCLLFSSNYEGYGMVIIEALSFGLPIIATQVGVAPEVIEDDKNGFLVEVGNEKEYLEALEKIIEKPLKSNGSLLFKKLPTKEEYLKRYKEVFINAI